MNIYIPYTYLIGWSKHNKFYYGRRTAKNCRPDEFWKKYFTSSKDVKSFRERFGEPDIILIRKTFPNNPDACKLWESKFLEKVNAQNNPKFLNKRNGDHKWDTTGMVVVNDAEGNKFCVSINDPRYTSGELISIQLTKSIQDKRKKTCLEKYGYESYISSPEGKEKSRQTCLEQYGYESHNSSPEIKEKKKKTCLENWGYEYASQSPKLKEKKKETCLEKHGVDNPNKIKITCCHCGEYKNIAHQSKCILNPNRNIPDRKGKNHPQSKCFKVTSPEDEVTIIYTIKNLEQFAKDKGLKHWNFAHIRKYDGWKIEEI